MTATTPETTSRWTPFVVAQACSGLAFGSIAATTLLVAWTMTSGRSDGPWTTVFWLLAAGLTLLVPAFVVGHPPTPPLAPTVQPPVDAPRQQEPLWRCLEPLERDERPLHAQVAERIREAIITGRLQAGRTLFSERAVARHLRVSPKTVRRAVDDLHETGYLEPRVGGGHTIRDAPPVSTAPKTPADDERGPARSGTVSVRVEV